MPLSVSYYLEALIWSAALVFLAFIDPSATQTFSLCPLHQLGFDFCTGCGLGRSVSFLLHGAVVESFATHILGIPAAAVIFHRIISLVIIIKRRYHFQHSHI